MIITNAKFIPDNDPASLFRGITFFLLLFACGPLISNDAYAVDGEINAPLILYTDIVSGPNGGGEKNNGSYLSIFGHHFGEPGELGKTTRVYINGQEVADYKYMGPAKGRADITQLAVQVGAINTGAITVTVNGVTSNGDHRFTVRKGDIYYVALDGDDANGEKNNINRPFRHVQNSEKGGVWWLDSFGAGDTIVMREGVWGAVQPNSRKRFLTVRDKSGSRDNPITITAYPGEAVKILSARKGIFAFYRSDRGKNPAEGVNITNLNLDGSDSTEGILTINIKTDHLRIVNNELANMHVSRAGTAAITGNGQHIKILGNSIHDNGDTRKMHGIYLDNQNGDGVDDVEIAYNHIYNQTKGNLIQTYWKKGTISNVSIHDNLIHDGERYGINIANGATHGINIYNNIIYNTAYAGIRFASKTLSNAQVYHNTLYNVNSANYNGAIQNDARVKTHGLVLKNNIIVTKGQQYSGSSENIRFSRSVVISSHNLWYGNGDAPSFDRDSIAANPLFSNEKRYDFHLKTDSPAVDIEGVDTVVARDYDGHIRPQGSAIDLGAYEQPQHTAHDNGPAKIIARPKAISNASDSARITWRADQFAAAAIEYGTTTRYGQQLTSTLYSKEHQHLLPELNADTTYHYRIHLRNRAGEENISADYQFKTQPKAPPVITKFTAVAVTEHSARIQWRTNRATANNSIIYSTNHRRNSEKQSQTHGTIHSVLLHDLEPNTRYNLTAKSRDETDKGAVSKTLSFVTADLGGSGDPVILYTDITSGTYRGGENNNGSYLSIFGKNFGDSSGLGSTTKAYINGKEVADYKYLGASRGRPDVAQLSVQIGNVRSGEIKVVVNGKVSNTDHYFRVRSGDIYYVSLQGDDPSGEVNNINRPFRYLQNGRGQGVWWLANFGRGDTIVMREGVWRDQSRDGHFLEVRNKSGDTLSPITIMGYPGEQVIIANGRDKSALSFIRARVSSTRKNVKNIIISNLIFDGEWINNRLIDLKWLSKDIRFINNELFNVSNGKAVIAGNGERIQLLGNTIHNNGSIKSRVHGIHINNANSELPGSVAVNPNSIGIAYNHIYKQVGKRSNLIQLEARFRGTTSDVNIHHNLLHDADNHAIDLGNGVGEQILIHNNVIYDTGNGGIRINSKTINHSGIYYNVLYNTNRLNTKAGALVNSWKIPADGIAIRNNIIYMLHGERYLSGSVKWRAPFFSRNLWYGGKRPPPYDDLALNAAPRFKNSKHHQFTLKQGSPAIDSGGHIVAPQGSYLERDFNGILRPVGRRSDVGAYEFTP